MHTDRAALGAQQLLAELAVVHPQVRRLDELQRKALHSNTQQKRKHMHDSSHTSESVLTPIKLLVPNETVPEETVPEETVPEETVPNEATASKHHMGGYFGDLRTV